MRYRLRTLVIVLTAIGAALLSSFALAFVLRDLFGFDRRMVGVIVVVTAPSIMSEILLATTPWRTGHT